MSLFIRLALLEKRCMSGLRVFRMRCFIGLTLVGVDALIWVKGAWAGIFIGLTLSGKRLIV